MHVKYVMKSVDYDFLLILAAKCRTENLIGYSAHDLDLLCMRNASMPILMVEEFVFSVKMHGIF